MVSIVQTVVRKHLGDEIPHVYELSKNVSFILQNSHFSVSYPRAFMPNVAEIACIHCKPAQPLPSVSVNKSWRNNEKLIRFFTALGLGRLHCRRRWFRIHLCFNGFLSKSSKHARKVTDITCEYICKIALSSALEVRIINYTKRFTPERENFPMASATRCARSQKITSFYHTWRLVEHVRNRLSWSTSSCYASFLRSRLEFRKSKSWRLWWEFIVVHPKHLFFHPFYLEQLSNYIWKHWLQKNSSKQSMQWYMIQNIDEKRSKWAWKF